MNLVDYSDSDESGNEAPAAAKVEQKPASQPPKHAVPKLIDRSNPSKIKVNLPTVSKEDVEKDGPPAKKQKTTGGGMFASMGAALPAPKHTGRRPLGRGLGSGVSLKTGAEKAFSGERAPVESSKPLETTDVATTPDIEKKEEKPFTPFGEVTRFKPLSVARAQQAKKKKNTVVPGPANGSSAASSVAAPNPTAPTKPKVSLFSMAEQDAPSTKSSTSEYKSILLESEKPPPNADIDEEDYSEAPTASAAAPPDPSSLNTLNLTAAERRQLFGRSGAVPEGLQIHNFNVDAQYASNQEYIKGGETVQHNPVRAIQPGKHSLRQLVNAAMVQKDALEESFANKSKKGTMGKGAGNW